MDTKLSKHLLVTNRCGVHARVATMIAKKAREFTSDLKIRKGNYEADGRSVLDLLSLGAFLGDALVIDVVGQDAHEAMQAIVALFEARFYEDDVEK